MNNNVCDNDAMQFILLLHTFQFLHFQQVEKTWSLVAKFHDACDINWFAMMMVMQFQSQKRTA